MSSIGSCMELQALHSSIGLQLPTQLLMAMQPLLCCLGYLNEPP